MAYEVLQEKVQNIDPVIDSLVANKKDIQSFLNHIEWKDVDKIVTYLDDNNVDDDIKRRALKQLWIKLSYNDALQYGVVSSDEIEKKVESYFPWIDTDTKNELLSDSSFLSSLPFDLDFNKISDSVTLNKLLAHTLIETYQEVDDFKKEVENIENEEDFWLTELFQNIQKKTGKKLDELDITEGNYIVFNKKNARDNTKELGWIISIKWFTPEELIEWTSQKWWAWIEIEYVSHNDNIIPSGSRKSEKLSLDHFQKLLINADLQGDFEVIHDKNEGNLRKNINDLWYWETETLVYGQKTIEQVNESLDFLDATGKNLNISKSTLPIWLKFRWKKGSAEAFNIKSYSDTASTITVWWILGDEILTYDNFILAFKEQKAKRFETIKSKESLLDSIQELEWIWESWSTWKVWDAGWSKWLQKSYKETDKTIVRELKYVRWKDDIAFEVSNISDNQVVLKVGKLQEPTKKDEDKNYKWSFSSDKIVMTLDQFLATVKNHKLEAVDDLWKEVDSIDDNSSWGEKIQKSFFRSFSSGFFNALSFADLKDWGKKFIEHIESNLKDAQYFKAEKAAYQYAKRFGLWDDYRIKLESRMSSKIDEIKDTLKSVSAPARERRIEKMMSNSNATTEEKIAAVLSILEKYGSLDAKGFQKYPLGTWYEFMWWKKWDTIWQKELERSQDPSLDVPFNEINVVMDLIQKWWKEWVTGTNVYKKIKASRPSWCKDELSTGEEDAASLKSASAKKKNFLDEFEGNTYANAIWNVKNIIQHWAITSNTDMAFYSNIMLLTGASDRYDELALKELQDIAYSGTCPSYIFLIKAWHMKVYRETLSALLWDKYGSTFDKLMSKSMSLKDKVKLFDEFWSSHWKEVNNAMNMIDNYTLLKRRDEEPFKTYLSIISSETWDMWGTLSNYPTSMKEGWWAASYDYDTFKKIEFDNGWGYRGNTEYIIKWTTKTLKGIASNPELSNQEKAKFMSEIALKLSKALLEKTNADAPSMKTFYENQWKWWQLAKLWIVKINNGDANPDKVETSHYDVMYNSILQKLKLNDWVDLNDYDENDEEELVEFTGSTQDYIWKLLDDRNNAQFESEVPGDIELDMDKYRGKDSYSQKIKDSISNDIDLLEYEHEWLNDWADGWDWGGGD